MQQMGTRIGLRILLIVGIIQSSLVAIGQDSRAQYPSFLQKSYFEVNIGYIQYPFSARQLEPGFQAGSIHIPHVGVRLVLLGYRINPNLSAQISYMRPVLWVEYKDVNGDAKKHSVFMNVGGFTMKPRVSLSKKISLFGEGGFALVTRSGFRVNDEMAVKDATMASVLLGGGVKFHLNKKFDLQASGLWSPSNSKKKQPSTTFISGGFTYNMNPLPAERVKRNSDSRYKFPAQVLQVGISTNALEYGVNTFFADGPVPVFWGGEVQVGRALAVHYQRNVFHARKVFSLDVGGSAGIWETRKLRQKFLSLAVYPVLRFTAIRTKSTDFYFTYSVAGPTICPNLCSIV